MPFCLRKISNGCWNWYCSGADMIFDSGGWDMACFLHLLHHEQRFCKAALRLGKKHFQRHLTAKSKSIDLLSIKKLIVSQATS